MPTGIFFAETAEIFADRLTMALKEPFQKLPFSGGADRLLFVEGRILPVMSE